MKTAIITGASSGLGVELLRAVAALCPEIEEFWLLARREDRLAAAAAQVEGKKTFLLPIDLTDYGRYDALRSPTSSGSSTTPASASWATTARSIRATITTSPI